MPPRGRWGAALVAAALVAGSSAAQLAVRIEPVKAQSTVPPPLPKPVLPTPTLSVPVPVAPKAPQAPVPVPAPAVPQPKLALPGTAPAVEAPALPLPGAPLRVATVPSVPPGMLSSPALAIRPPPPSGATAASLEEARRQRQQQLLRQQPLLLESDEQGNPVVRGKLLLLDPDAALLRRLRRSGFRVISDSVEAGLGLRLVELAVPAGFTSLQALRRLRSIAPGAAADFDHIFQPAGGALAPAAVAIARSAGQGRLLIGMVDGGVAEHPSLAGTSVEQRPFAGAVRATEHGTAVASLIAGGHGAFKGSAKGAALAVADVYGGRQSAGSASAIVRALGWLASKPARVINISLVGPSNRLLGAAVRAVRARSIQVVAPVGNDGPASPPQYPASYPGVLSITGVDPSGRALLEAGNAAHVDFAAPAAEMAAARPGRGYGRVRGTSFAAPLAAGRLALLGSVPRLAAEARPGKGRVGRGIVCWQCRTDPARLRSE